MRDVLARLDIVDSMDKKMDKLCDEVNCTFTALKSELSELREEVGSLKKENEGLVKENKELKSSVQTLSDKLTAATRDNKQLKETVLDLQARSMRDNLIFTGIPEHADRSPAEAESALRAFLTDKMKIPPDTAKHITFHHVHRLGPIRPDNKNPRPIIAKVEHYKHKELIKGYGKELRGTRHGVNDQYPREILERRKVLFPVRKQFIDSKRKAVISVDKLYVDGQLYRDSKLTPWLY